MQNDKLYMQRCIQLASQGRGFVAPNPMVGAVIVHNDLIIGEGYHQQYGEAHAEVNAINSVKNTSLLIDSTIYVSLEPCAHFGKTPPCVNLIVKTKFKRVVIGSLDPNPDVDGKGVSILEMANIEVTKGVLEKECKELNKHFFISHKTKRPFVFLKWAQTSNKLMNDDFKQSWISCPEAQTVVHSWRSEHQAIMVGRKTIESDNPSLTVRRVKGKNPIRIVIDPNLSLKNDFKIFNKDSKTIIINLIKNKIEGDIQFVQLEKIDTVSILDLLYKLDIQSVLIEGGKETLQSFIDSNLWDEAKVITSPKTFLSGTPSPEITTKQTSSSLFFDDTITHFINKNS